METRSNVRFGLLVVLIQQFILFLSLFIIIYNIPSEWLPDQFDDGYGNVYDLPPSKKKEIKAFALYGVAILGTSYCSIQFYFYRVAKRWASKEFMFAQINKKKYLEHVNKKTTVPR